jgi:hypothetical protein
LDFAKHFAKGVFWNQSGLAGQQKGAAARAAAPALLVYSRTITINSPSQRHTIKTIIGPFV